MIIPDANAKESDYIFATDAEVRLQFDGYDDEKYMEGYVLAYYTGSFRLVGKDGKTYVSKFMEQFCYSINFDQYNAGNTSYEGMYDEDPDYDPYHGIEDIQTPEKQATKVLHNGTLYIATPDGAIYNATGIRVK